MNISYLAFHTEPKIFEVCPRCQGQRIIKEVYDDGFDIREGYCECRECRMKGFILSKEKYGEMANSF